MPPTPRTLRLLAKTFALWQDTWYYDRRQQEFGHLMDYMKMPKIQPGLEKIDGLKTYTAVDDYEKIPIEIRQALAVHVTLANVLSSDEYGCRGPNKDGKFGAGTYHVEPEDLLAGG